MTYLSELRSSLVEAAHRQHASAEQAASRHTPSGRPAPRAWSRPSIGFSRELWRESLHGGRAILASIALGLAGTAVGAVQVGPPLGPEPQLSAPLSQTVGSPPNREQAP